MYNHEHHEDNDFSLMSLFVPLTTFKAIHIIVIVGFIIYANMLFNGFVWDDKTYIIFNPQIHSFDFIKLIQQNLFNTAGNYRPISALYFSSLFAVFKDMSFFYHLPQLILHIVNASLLFVLFKKFINKKISLFLSFIFLVHPIQVESVSYIASTGNQFFFLFGIAALLLLLRNNLETKGLIVASLLLLLSILAKETGFLFLFISFLYLVFFRKRYICPFLISGFVISIFYFLIRFGIGGVYLSKLDIIPINKLSLIERIVNIPSIIYYYLKTFAYPAHLVIDQLWVVSSLNFRSFYFPLLLLIIIFSLFMIVAVYCYKRNKPYFLTYLFFLLWFTAGIFMHAQILPLNLTVADRWFYFPMAGLLGLLGIFIESTKPFYKHIKKEVLYVIAIVFVVLLSTRTIVRNANWHDALTLYLHDSKIKTNYDLENMLGAEYANIQKYDKALVHYKKSRELYVFPVNTYNIGYVYEQKEDYQKAKEYYANAIKEGVKFSLKDDQMMVLYERIARVKVLSDPPDVSNEFIKKKLWAYPNSGALWMYKAINEYKLNNQEEALIAAQKAKELLPVEQTNYVYSQILNKQSIEVVP